MVAPNKESDFKLNTKILKQLGQAEQQVVSVKKLSTAGIPNLRRGFSVGFENYAEKILEQPAVYMNPHKNALEEEVKKRNKFKPKIMLGDIRKPSCQFTSDLVIIQHNTRVIKKKMADMGT